MHSSQHFQVVTFRLFCSTNANLWPTAPPATNFSAIWTKNKIIFIQENVFENVVWNVSTILSLLPCDHMCSMVKLMTRWKQIYFIDYVYSQDTKVLAFDMIPFYTWFNLLTSFRRLSTRLRLLARWASFIKVVQLRLGHGYITTPWFYVGYD